MDTRGHKDMYDDICEPAFTEIKKQLQEVLGYLKGDADKPGLCERVRALESGKKLMIGTVAAVALLLATEVIHLIFKGL